MANKRRKRRSTKNVVVIPKKIKTKKRTGTKKKKTKRDQAKYPGLEPKFFSRIKQEFHDLDYVDQLSDKEKAWMSAFMEEWVGARLNHPGKKFHKSAKDRKKVFDANNARNRDFMSKPRVDSKHLDYVELDRSIDTPIMDEIRELLTHNPEEMYIKLLDNRRKIKRKLTKIELEKLVEEAKLLQEKDDSSSSGD